MGLREIIRGLRFAPVVDNAEDRSRSRRSAQFSMEVPQEMTAGDRAGRAFSRTVTRDEALSVPAVMRARNLICGTLATLPIRRHGPDRRVLPWSLATQIDPDMPNTVVIAQTLEDMIFEGMAWWRVIARDARGFPTAARFVPNEAVVIQPTSWPGAEGWISRDHPFPEDGRVYIDGLPVDDLDVIRFDSPNPPVLKHGARAIRMALMLENMAALYSSEPMGLGYFEKGENMDSLSDEQIEELLDDWADLRSRRAWGYLKGLKAQLLQWDAEKLQLHEQRQHAVLEIAREFGLDSEDLGVSTTSRTYANVEQKRMDLTTFTLGAYVSTFQDRLTMQDVLPRGHYARMSFDGFLRGDTVTRMQAYQIGKPLGAYTSPEIRELEDRPPLTPAEATAIDTPAPAPAADEPAELEREGATVIPMQHPAGARFDVDTVETLEPSFDAGDVDGRFEVDKDRRIVTGLIIPWGKVAMSRGMQWRFARGSVVWSTAASRVKLTLAHDTSQAFGHAVNLEDTTAGLVGKFKIARTPEGDRALVLAEDGVYDGLSAGVEFDSDESWAPDPNDRTVNVVRRAVLKETTLTAFPSFDDARVSDVAASRDQGDRRMAPTKTEPAAKPATGGDGSEFDLGTYLEDLGKFVAESHKKLVEDLTASFGESIAAGITTALEQQDAADDGPKPVRAARFRVTREAPVYRFDGSGGHSMVRDAYYARHQHDEDAYARLRKHEKMTADAAKLALEDLRAGAGFAPITTAGASQIIPPGYRPDLYVPQLSQARPLVSGCSLGTIDNATPFVVPVFATSTGVGDHVEGTNPADGTLTFTTKTVTPGGISGKLVLTREIVDSSNPAIDAIAMATMRELYARQTEAKVYALLNGANGAGGVITGDFVPSGAQASTIVAAATAAGGQALIKHVRERLAKYPFNRFLSPDVAFMGQNATTRFATAEDNSGRPLLPSVGAQNAAGLGNAVQQAWFVDGLAFVPAWAMTGVAAGDSQILAINRADAWVWESPLLMFRYEEKSGPANIELALFGYFATHLLRPVGLSGIRITLT